MVQSPVQMDRTRKIVCLYLGKFPTICPKEKLQIAIPKLKMEKGIPETSPVKYCMPENQCAANHCIQTVKMLPEKVENSNPQVRSAE